jgi:hypothetical protein
VVGAAIIWGGNYFDLPPSKGWLIWDKMQPENFTLAMCELAWTSDSEPPGCFITADGHASKLASDERVHPTQKPVELMEWCLVVRERRQTRFSTRTWAVGNNGSCVQRPGVQLRRNRSETLTTSTCLQSIEAALNAEPLLKEVSA